MPRVPPLVEMRDVFVLSSLNVCLHGAIILRTTEAGGTRGLVVLERARG